MYKRSGPRPDGDTGRALTRLDDALNKGYSERLVALASDLRSRLAADKGLDAASPAAAAALADVLAGRGRATRAFQMLVASDATGRSAVEYARLLPRNEALRRTLLRAAAASPTALATVAASGVVPKNDVACALLTAAGRRRDADAVAAEVKFQLFRARTRGSSSPAVLNAALGAWLDVGKPDKAFDTYAKFRRLGVVPETRTYNVLLRACRAARDAPRAARLYSRMLRLGPPPDAYTVSAALSSVATGGDVDPAWAVAVFERGGARAAADAAAVAALLYALRRAPAPPPPAAVDAAFAAYDVLRESGDADAWATAEALHLAAAAGAPARARAVWTATLAAGPRPSHHTYSALFVAAATAAAQSADADLVALADAAGASLRADWDAAVAAAAPSPPPPATVRSHLVAHNALMHFLAASARCDDARMLLDVMLVAGPPPDVVTLNAALDAAAQAGDVDAAFAVHGLASGDTVPVTGRAGAGTAITPDVETFGALLHACARAGAADDAAAVMATMRDAGVTPSVQAYTSYMSALVAAEARAAARDGGARGGRRARAGGPVAVATSVLADMTAAGLEPTAVTYGVLLSAASAAGDAGAALAFYADAAARGVALTDECHAKLAIAAANAGRPDDALAAVRGLARARSEAAGPALNSLARALAARGRVARALRVLSLARTTGADVAPATLDALLGACATDGALADAEALAREMAAAGVPPSRASGSALIVALVDAGRLAPALRVYAEMTRGELAPRPGGATAGGDPAAAPARAARRGARVRDPASTRSRRAAGAEAPALASLVAGMARAGDVDGALRLYRGALRPRALAVADATAAAASRAAGELPPPPPPPGTERAWAAIIEAACASGRVDDALAAFDDWRAAADAAAATGAPPLSLSPATLAFLEATCRGVPGHGDDVLSVCAAMRTQAARAAARAAPAPVKSSHHVLGSVKAAGSKNEAEETVPTASVVAPATPLGPAAAAAAARRALIGAAPPGAASKARRAAEAAAARAALRARLESRRAKERREERERGDGLRAPAPPPSELAADARLTRPRAPPSRWVD